MGTEAFTCRPVPPPALLAELSRLQSHPGYDVTVTNGSPACRFEASLTARTRVSRPAAPPDGESHVRRSLTAGSAKARHPAK